ncbi:LuxR C-terminal-related transcriptional regulator [Streptomyces sp. ADMS]|nr:LuxR C-terminal-related transcriptional regulator [Streptomyces sp. ADMS]MDW4907105.1 LuxR C-terminal-related transcriptional regulator [Streptomyces sp. ADMS]
MSVPAETTSFVGRRDEQAEVRALLARARLVTLTGPGGVGKTRLVGRVAARVARAFPDGVCFVHLADLDDPDLVPRAVADTLGLYDHSTHRRARTLDALVARLRSRRLLLVLDNCEHLHGACAELTGTLLHGTTGVRVLATSRHRLGLTEEHLVDVRPLPVPDPDGDLSAAHRHPALALFADRAAAAAPGFTLTPANRTAVARLCRGLDGLPLAIELAAARMGEQGEQGEPVIDGLAVDDLRTRIDDDDHRHHVDPRHDRHRTLRAAIDWSHRLCTPAERLVWARASVLAADFDLETAEAVCGEGVDDVLEAVSGLVAKSVLSREPGPHGCVRYRLLDTLRQYGLDRLRQPPGAERAVRRRHRDWMQTRASVYEHAWFGPDQQQMAARLRADRSNLRAVLDFGLGTPGAVSARPGDSPAAPAGTGAAGPGGAVFGGAGPVPGATGVVPGGGGAVVGGAGVVSGSGGPVPGATGAVSGSEGPVVGGAGVVSGRGGPVAGGTGAVSGGGGCVEGAAGVVSGSGGAVVGGAGVVSGSGGPVVGATGVVSGGGGPVAGGTGGVPRGTASVPGDFGTAAVDAPATPDASHGTPGDALAALRLAGTLWFHWSACGAPGEGRYWLDRALEANRGPSRERARGLWVSGLLALLTGSSEDLARGRLRAEEARALARRLGDAAEAAHAGYVIGAGQLLGGEPAAALRHFEDAVAREPVPGGHAGLAGLERVQLACALVSLGEVDRAVAVCGNVLRVCGEYGEEWVRSCALRALALAHTVREDWRLAEPPAREALRIGHTLHDVLGIASALDLLALIATAHQHGHERAAVLLGGADRLRSTPLDSVRQDGETRAREGLGRRAYERAYRRGEGLGLTGIVKYALGEGKSADQGAEPPSSTDCLSGRGTTLTRRETEVAALIAEGLANQQIADRLVIARRTAEGHVERILGKLGLTNRTQIAAWVTTHR